MKLEKENSRKAERASQQQKRSSPTLQEPPVKAIPKAALPAALARAVATAAIAFRGPTKIN